MHIGVNQSLKRPQASQLGFGLVEILVAMAIGLFLAAGIIQIFSGSSQTYRVQDNLAHLQENGRFALIQLTNTLRKTGFKTDASESTDLAFPVGSYFSSPNNASFAAGQLVTGTEAAGSPDQITLRFQGASDGTTVDCLGLQVNPGSTAVNQFSVNTGNLRCRSSLTTTPQDTIENVEDMQIRYGVDSDGSGSANYYVTATQVTDWSQVVSLQVSLLLRTQEDNLASAAQTYQYNGASITAGDRRIRNVFTTTIALRNLLP